MLVKFMISLFSLANPDPNVQLKVSSWSEIQHEKETLALQKSSWWQSVLQFDALGWHEQAAFDFDLPSEKKISKDSPASEEIVSKTSLQDAASLKLQASSRSPFLPPLKTLSFRTHVLEPTANLGLPLLLEYSVSDFNSSDSLRQKHRGMLFLKSFQAPMVLLRLGIFGSSSHFKAEKFLASWIFESLPFHLLILESTTNPEFLSRNEIKSLDQLKGPRNDLEAQQTQFWTEALMKVPEFKVRISSFHLMAMSFGGLGLVATTLNQGSLKDPRPFVTNSPPQPLPIETITAFCPLVHHRRTFYYHRQNPWLLWFVKQWMGVRLGKHAALFDQEPPQPWSSEEIEDQHLFRSWLLISTQQDWLVPWSLNAKLLPVAQRLDLEYGNHCGLMGIYPTFPLKQKIWEHISQDSTHQMLSEVPIPLWLQAENNTSSAGNSLSPSKSVELLESDKSLQLGSKNLSGTKETHFTSPQESKAAHFLKYQNWLNEVSERWPQSRIHFYSLLASNYNSENEKNPWPKTLRIQIVARPRNWGVFFNYLFSKTFYFSVKTLGLKMALGKLFWDEINLDLPNPFLHPSILFLKSSSESSTKPDSKIFNASSLGWNDRLEQDHQIPEATLDNTHRAAAQFYRQLFASLKPLRKLSDLPTQ